MKRVLIFIILIFHNSCTVYRYFTQDQLIDRSFRTSNNTMLNYEDASRKYTIDSINDHYRLHVEIEKPYVISSVNYDVQRIYRISDIEGTAIFRAKLNKKGRIISYVLVKSAGLGLDKIANDVIKSIKISPASIAGNLHNAEVYLKIAVYGRDRI